MTDPAIYTLLYSLHIEGNAAPLLDQSSDIITLVFCRDNTEVFSLQSSDDGATWVDLRNITAAVREPQWGFTGSGPPGGIQLPSGRLVIGEGIYLSPLYLLLLPL